MKRLTMGFVSGRELSVIAKNIRAGRDAIEFEADGEECVIYKQNMEFFRMGPVKNRLLDRLREKVDISEGED